MRKTFLILSLAGLTVLAGASDAFAQRGYYGGGRGNSIGVGRGGWGYSPGISNGVGNGGYYSGYGNGGYYSGYGNGGLGYGYGGLGSGYSYAPSYYFASPSYYTDPAFGVSQAPIRQSYYQAPPAAQEQHANVMVLVPTADAQVWFDGHATRQQGMERLFHSPLLEPNHTFSYTVKARWMENGKAIDRERQAKVQSGQSVTVDFRNDRGESVAPPLPNAIPRD